MARRLALAFAALLAAAACRGVVHARPGDAPDQETLAVGVGSATLGWSPIPGVAAYEVRMSSTGTAGLASAVAVDVAGTSYSVAGLDTSLTWSFLVIATGGDPRSGTALSARPLPRGGLGAQPIVTLVGTAGSVRLGQGAPIAADFDGDGAIDLAVGGWGFPNSNDKGTVAIYPSVLTAGSSGRFTAAIGGNGDVEYGWSLSSPVAVDGDVFPDFFVGIPSFAPSVFDLQPPGGSPGRLDVCFGGLNMPPMRCSRVFTSTSNGDAFGWAMEIVTTSSGDLQLAVGAPDTGAPTSPALNFDAAFPSPWPGAVDFVDVKPSAAGAVVGVATVGTDGALGASLAHGNVEGDGDEIIAGAPLYRGDDRGAIAIVRPGAATILAEGDGPVCWLGFSLAVGDVDGDGYDDILAGAPDCKSSGNPAFGRAELFRGGPTVSSTPSWIVTGASLDQEGISVALEDVNGDGYADAIVGARGDPAFSMPGRVDVYLGGPAGLSTSAAWTRSGENAGDEFGQTVSALGDVDGDGYPDVAISAQGYAGGAGKVYLEPGRPTDGPAPSAGTSLRARRDQVISPQGATISDPVLSRVHRCVWSWGDGTIDTLSPCTDATAVTHAWKRSGYFAITLRVEDAADGRAGEALTHVLVGR